MITMKFGVSPSAFLWWKNVGQFEEWIVEAENCGYEAVFVPDHYNVPVPMFPTNELLDAWSTLSYVAAKTNYIKVGTCVTPLPRWLPSQLAKVISTVDILSNGRVIVGLGAGVFPEEFINYSPQGDFDEPEKRVEKFVEGLQVMIQLWSKDKANFNGKYYKLKDAVLLPKPKQKPKPPLWSGGLGQQMLKITAKYFDAWLPHRGAYPPEKYEHGTKIIKEYLKKYEKSASEFTFSLLTWITENVTDQISMLEKYVQAGCQHCVVEIPLTQPLSNGKYIEAIRKFAKEVMPSF